MSSRQPGEATPWVDVAYTYAWWLTGTDEAAAAALQAAATPDAGSSSREELLASVRAAVGGTIAMGPAAEVALLHDVAGLSLRAAATLAGVPEDDAPSLLANGRLEALATPPDVPVEHPQRIGGLATGSRRDASHARLCSSCRRLSELIAQGRQELVAIAPVPVPAAVAAQLAPASMPGIPPVGAPAPEEPADPGAQGQGVAPEDPSGVVVVDEPRPDVSGTQVPETDVAPTDEEAAEPETEREPVREGGGAEVAAHDSAAAAVETPSDEAVTDKQTDIAGPIADTSAEVEVVAEPDVEVVVEPPVVERDLDAGVTAGAAAAAVDEIDLEPAEAPTEEAEEAEEARPPRAALLLASMGVAIFVVGALLWVFRPDDATTGDVEQSEPAVVATQAPASEPIPQSTESEPSGPASEPTGGQGFVVVDAGLIPPGEEEIAPSGAVIAPTDPVVVAVDYKGAKGGVPLEAEWTVGGELYRVLSAELQGSSRHIFGEPVPAGGWPVGEHHIILTTDDGVVGSIDFTVE